MSLGSHRKTIELNAASGKDAVALRKLQAQPDLGELATLYYRGWVSLSGSRGGVGLGVGAIPYTTITAWARDQGIEDPDDLALVVFGVQALDTDYLNHVAKPTPSSRAKPPPSRK